MFKFDYTHTFSSPSSLPDIDLKGQVRYSHDDLFVWKALFFMTQMDCKKETMDDVSIYAMLGS